MKPSRVIVGVAFIAFGLIKLGDELGFYEFDWFSFRRYWPVLLILWGVWMLVRDKPQQPYEPPVSSTHFPEDPQMTYTPPTPEPPQSIYTPPTPGTPQTPEPPHQPL